MTIAIKTRTALNRLLAKWRQDLLWGLTVVGSDGRLCCDEGEDAACPACRAQRKRALAATTGNGHDDRPT